MSLKTHSMAVLSELSKFICEDTICDALSACNLFNDTMHAK